MRRRIIIIASLALILGLGVFAAITWHQINNPEDLFRNPHVSGQNPSPDPSSAGPNQIQPTEEPYKFSESKLNILLLGLDADEHRYRSMDVFRTDTIMLVSIDFSQNKTDLISIPRDSYVKIPGRKARGRVNAAFVYGGGFKKEGFTTTLKTVSDLLNGVPIHYYAAIDMNAFIKIIDGLGGITYDVDVPVPGTNIEPGVQKLDGAQTLNYARHRYTAGGDIDRVKRQQRLLTSILDQLKSTESLTKLPAIYDSIKEDIWTNLNIKQVAALALFASKMDMDRLQRHMIPGNYLDMDNISYWGIDQKKKNELVNELFGINVTTYDKEDDIHYIKQQLRKRLDEIKSLAQEWIDKGTKFLNENRSVLYTDELLKVESSVQLLVNGITEGELDDIDTNAHILEEDMSTILPLLDKRKTNLNNALYVLSKVETEMATLKDKLVDEEWAQLIDKIAIVKQKIEQKAFPELPSVAEELNAYWDHLGKYVNGKPEPSSTPEPHITDDPTPTSTPEVSSLPTETPTEAPTEAPTETPSPTPNANAAP
jgi:LCP family protein required for cell wall assembly